MLSQIESAPVRNNANVVILPKVTPLFSLHILLCMKNILANRRLFWAKTDLRTEEFSCILSRQPSPKTSRPASRETTFFVKFGETEALCSLNWRDCRGMAPFEGTERWCSSFVPATHPLLQRHGPVRGD